MQITDSSKMVPSARLPGTSPATAQVRFAMQNLVIAGESVLDLCAGQRVVSQLWKLILSYVVLYIKQSASFRQYTVPSMMRLILKKMSLDSKSIA